MTSKFNWELLRKARSALVADCCARAPQTETLTLALEAIEHTLRVAADTNLATTAEVYGLIPHPHAELIQAYKNGAEIEYYSRWLASWVAVSEPLWHHKAQYRINPASPSGL